LTGKALPFDTPAVPTAEIPLVRIQLRYPDEAVFIQRFAPNVTRGGVFLASRNPHPVGNILRFEIVLGQGQPVLWGTGKVTWVREFNPQEPQRTHGMGVQFIQLAPESRAMLDRLLMQKAQPARYTPVSGVPHTPARDSDQPSGPMDKLVLDGDPSTWIDDQSLRQASDRARVLASRVEDVEALRGQDREEAPTLEEALKELPRLLGQRRQP
jgi:uncharacterized protein (TIGR02266 family)